MRYFILVSLFFSLNTYGSSEFKANDLLRRETLRLTVESRPEIPSDRSLPLETLSEEPLHETLLAASTGIGFFPQTLLLARGLEKASNQPQNAIGKRESIVRATLLAVNVTVFVYGSTLFYPPGEPHISESSTPLSHGIFQTYASAALITPQILAILKEPHYFRKWFLWPTITAVWGGASVFGYQASTNFSAGSVEKEKHVRLTPGQFQSPIDKIQRKIIEDRIYVLGVHSPAKVGILKEHIRNDPNNWLKTLPDVQVPSGDQIVSDEAIQRFTTINEHVRESMHLLSGLDFGNNSLLPEGFLAEERRIYIDFIQNRIQLYRDENRHLKSAKRAEGILSQAGLLVEAI